MGAGIAASPHLRRAKDLPVFASLAAFAPRSSILAHQLRRRFRKWSCPEGQVLFLPRPFLDQSPFASPAPRGAPRLAQERMALPAPLPAGPTWNRSSSSSPAGGDRTFRPFPPRRAGTSVPITHSLCASPRVAQSGICSPKPVDNGDIGHKLRARSESARLPFCSAAPTSPLCPNPPPSRPSLPICRASTPLSARRC